ncbi:hypothetical protein F2Q70_00004853 [Brassica cretica]|uniref:Uncharacterized protein n=1 Tax=Brassica cretica TaxID=69181 RepID=A0A8S9IYC2_BRACR|nr:hypothetical protein F2Q70_00004853 [Brassica cretica]
MPLTAPTILPGFEPHPSIVAPEVFEKMRLYMDYVDLEERIIRVAKMRKTLQELSKDPIARDHISDWKEHDWFPRKSIETEEDLSTSRLPEMLEDEETRREVVADSTMRLDENKGSEQRMSVNEQHRLLNKRGEEGYTADQEYGLQLGNMRSGGFVMGVGTSNGAARSSRSRKTHSSYSSWVRRNQNKRRGTQEADAMAQQSREEGQIKRKAHEVGLSGGLALFWKKSYEVEILRSSSRIIDTKVKAGNLVYYMTFFYGDLVRQRRNEFWTELKSIGLNRNGGWGLAGNFNEFMSSEKKLGGPVRVESSFYQFRSMARICKIKEIPSSGDKLSWAGVREVITNGVKENVWIQCRLARAFENPELFRLFPRSHL